MLIIGVLFAIAIKEYAKTRSVGAIINNISGIILFFFYMFSQWIFKFAFFDIKLKDKIDFENQFWIKIVKELNGFGFGQNNINHTKLGMKVCKGFEKYKLIGISIYI